MFALPGARLRPTLRSFHQLSNVTKSSTPRVKLIRNYSPYPKEGVFQPNSPPHPGLNPQQHSQPPPPPPPPQQQPPNVTPRRSYVKVIIDGLVAVLGFGLAWTLVENAIEIRFPQILDAEPGSAEDTMAIQELYDDLGELRGVQELRNEVIIEDGKRIPAFREWVAYNGFTDEDRRALRLTTGPLGGYNGVAAQFVFWCEKTRELCVFIHFGPKTCGWPGVVHGGAIATVLDESCGRVAILTAEERTAVTAQLKIDYMDKIEPGVWYMVCVRPNPTKTSTDKKKYVSASVVCVSDEGPYRDGNGAWDGQVHMHCMAEGLFVVPKQVPLSPIPDEF